MTETIEIRPSSKIVEQQVALITGGSTGIGAAVALHLAQAGYKVLITGRHEATLRESATRHENITYVVADVSRPTDAARSVEEVKARFGRLDVLVNNAGVAEAAPLAGAKDDHARRIFEINVLGTIETTRNALPLLEQSKGTIINVTSVVADEPLPNMSVYCASKAAGLALTRAWAQELAPAGIRVNAVSPGPIATPMTTPEKLHMSPEQFEQLFTPIVQLVPMKRVGKPEEVASVIAFLASKDASYITGAQYTVAGGMEA